MFNNIYEIVIIAIGKTPICPLKPRKSRLDKRINKIPPIKKLDIKYTLYFTHMKSIIIIIIKNNIISNELIAIIKII